VSRDLDLAAREIELRRSGFTIIAGIDEAGRGPLAGPVVAACTVLKALLPVAGIDDSKRLSPKRRAALAIEIRRHAAACGIGVAEPAEIDALNIYRATQLAMRRALEAAALRPEILLIDAMPLPGLGLPVESIVGGDARCTAIAAASILAKEHRDALLRDLDAIDPRYGFARHKGYGTPEHLDALRRYGPSPYHRRSFAPVAEAAGRR